MGSVPSQYSQPLIMTIIKGKFIRLDEKKIEKLKDLRFY